jgi:PAS domain S-box-containing protein
VERRFRAIFDASPDCIKLVSADGSLVDMNLAGLRMIDADCVSQVRGKSLFALIDPAFHQRFRDCVATVFAGKTAQIQFEVVGLHGRRLFMDQTAAPLFASDDSARVVEMVAVTRDITQQRRVEANLLQVRLAKEIADSAAHHVGSLGQRLKTPLQAIIGYTEMALEGALEQGRDRDAQDAQHVLNAADELRSLLNSMLRTTLSETRKATATGDVDDLLETAVASVRALAEANGTQIRLEVDPRCASLPEEEDMLSQCLQALLSYAAKNTRNGVITVRARPVLANGPPRLSFSVTDNGEGLAPEQLKSLFEAPTIADAAASGARAAALAGLVAANELAAFMGGTIKATSALGRGSRFTLEVPVRQLAAQAISR